MDDSVILVMVVLYIAYSAIKEKLEEAKRGRKVPGPQPQKTPEMEETPKPDARQPASEGNLDFQIPRIEGAPPEDSYPVNMPQPAQWPQSAETGKLPEPGDGYEANEWETERKEHDESDAYDGYKEHDEDTSVHDADGPMAEEVHPALQPVVEPSQSIPQAQKIAGADLLSLIFGRHENLPAIFLIFCKKCWKTSRDFSVG